MEEVLGLSLKTEVKKVILKQKPRKDYGTFGFFEASKIPERPCFGYEREIEAGMGICSNVLDYETMFLLVFGVPGTGKTLYPCVLANRFNSISKERFSLAFIQCASEYYTEEKQVKKLYDFIKTLRKRFPLIVHLVELDALNRPYENHNHYAPTTVLLSKLLRLLFSEEHEKRLLIATTSAPDCIDPVFLSRFDNTIYIEPTSRDHIAQIITHFLNRDDSKKITEKLLRYFLDFQPPMIPLGRDVVRACRLLKRQYKDIDDLAPENISVLLKRFISPFPSKRIDEYEQKHKVLMERSNLQLKYWLESHKEFSR